LAQPQALSFWTQPILQRSLVDSDDSSDVCSSPTHRCLLPGMPPLESEGTRFSSRFTTLRTSRCRGEDAFRSFTEGWEFHPTSKAKLRFSPLPSCSLSGSDRLGLAAFPPLQTGRAPFNASGFPVRSPYCSAAGWRLVRSSQSAPAIVPTDHRHLLSLVHPLNRLSENLPWQTFTLSRPLQPGLWHEVGRQRGTV
jgi:hypothetical protein